MKLTIISPVEIKEFTVSWVELNTTAGNFIIQPAHAPTIFVLKPKSIVITQLANGNREIIAVNEGIAEITRASVTILANNQTL